MIFSIFVKGRIYKQTLAILYSSLLNTQYLSIDSCKIDILCAFKIKFVFVLSFVNFKCYYIGLDVGKNILD